MFKLHMQILYQTSDTKSNHTSTIKPEHKKKKKKKITSICFLKLEEVKADFFHQDRDKIGRVPRTSVLLPCLVVD